MKLTKYHSKYIANDLTRRTGNDLDRLSMSLFDAAVDMNPHQIEAALFAMQSPLSNGSILADEVGLGKTIEAGIVICQYWAERKRSILIITPASIRKQWGFEIEEKFHLPVLILDKKTYNVLQKQGKSPLAQKAIIILSYNFASRIKSEIAMKKWDLVVIDEAHKLRNAYRESNVMGQAIRQATGDSKKLLLTATPLQNSLLELYGLSVMIDENIFGDVNSFKSRFMSGGNLEDLQKRISPYCHRTLRKQVTEYVQYTQRQAITEPFDPTDDEYKFYEAVSAFLQHPDSYAIPQKQRHLTQMILRKLLASSSGAIAATFDIMLTRLKKMRLGKNIEEESFVENLLESEEMEDDLLDEILSEKQDSESDNQEKKIDYESLESEITELEGLSEWAHKIKVDSKSKALLSALSIGFKKMTEMGAAQKAVIFTESRRTQEYLKEYLTANGYGDTILCFNGTNKGAAESEIYESWQQANQGTGRVSGVRDIDIRTAILDRFRDKASILIATEAAAEGVNLQFCSLVINYDLPWNPQRIEQRIGRCHRYGQKHDVVVINFLNKRNDADRRVLELLTEKFRLFDGVFGASDEVLGSVESGIDFEKNILNIYQRCRTPEEIDAAFFELRQKMDETIRQRENKMQKILLEHFDEDVHERLRIKAEGTKQLLDRFGKRFWDLTRFELEDCAVFHNDDQSFDLTKTPLPEAKTGRYHLISQQMRRQTGNGESEFGNSYLYRLSHPLGEYVIKQAKECDTPDAEITFRLDKYPKKISLLEPLVGKSGYLTLTRLTIESFEEEIYLLFNGYTDDGTIVDQETIEKMFHLEGDLTAEFVIPTMEKQRLEEDTKQHILSAEHRSMEQNNRYFNEAQERLDKWADDQIDELENNIKKQKIKLRECRNRARQAENITEKLDFENEARKLEKLIRRLRNERDDREEEIEAKREELIDQIRKRLRGGEKTERLFSLRWSIR